MTNDKSYRLDNYRITVYDDVLVRWEHHAPLGMARSGKCFLYKDVLIIGKKNRDEDGFLVGEFLDRRTNFRPGPGPAIIALRANSSTPRQVKV